MAGASAAVGSEVGLSRVVYGPTGAHRGAVAWPKGASFGGDEHQRGGLPGYFRMMARSIAHSALLYI